MHKCNQDQTISRETCYKTANILNWKMDVKFAFLGNILDACKGPKILRDPTQGEPIILLFISHRHAMADR